MKDLKADLCLHVPAGRAQQHSRRGEQELDAAAPEHEQVCKVPGRWFCDGFSASGEGSDCRILFFHSGVSSVANLGLTTVLSTARLHQLCVSLWRFSLSFIQMNVELLSILGCKWMQVQMNGCTGSTSLLPLWLSRYISSPHAGAPRLAPASCTYLKSVYEKRGSIPTWKQKCKEAGRKALRRGQR